MIHHNYYVWVEIEANKKRIINEAHFRRVMEHCKISGIGSIILAVKDTSGFGIYKSNIVPHYHQFDADFEDIDYLELCTRIAHEHGLKLYAAIDVFAEGRIKHPHPLSPAYIHPEWQTSMYGLDENNQPAIRPISALNGLRTTGSIDDFNEIFVNPIRPEVRDYEASIVKDIIDRYPVDGVVLDRVRFIGIGSDFSEFTRQQFEAFIHEPVVQWPQDIYTLVPQGDKLEIQFGKRFGQWMTFRASIIKTFILQIREIIDNTSHKVEFVDYTGSWYPLYYLLGVNWASENYVPDDYPWVGKEYAATGYAEYLDTLLSGFYYEDVTIQDAVAHNKPATWYSVEGSGELLQKVVGSAVPYAGSLLLTQYKDEPEKFKQAIDMCFSKSSGCMLFDMCYLDDYHWWDVAKR